MLIRQLCVQFIFKHLQRSRFIVLAGNYLGSSLIFGGAKLDEVLEVVIINIVWCRVTTLAGCLPTEIRVCTLTCRPFRHRPLVERIAKLHRTR